MTSCRGPSLIDFKPHAAQGRPVRLVALVKLQSHNVIMMLGIR